MPRSYYATAQDSLLPRAFLRVNLFGGGEAAPTAQH
jgi:hypothetical protein